MGKKKEKSDKHETSKTAKYYNPYSQSEDDL